jgi:hypothetical protein
LTLPQLVLKIELLYGGNACTSSFQAIHRSANSQ